jgi:hypothetical protein
MENAKLLQRLANTEEVLFLAINILDVTGEKSEKFQREKNAAPRQRNVLERFATSKRSVFGLEMQFP